MKSAVLLLPTLLNVAVHAQRPVFPLIANGIAPNGARVDGNGVSNDQPAKSEASKEWSFAVSLNSQYVKTSGSPKNCRQHSDCYSWREPDDWCLSYANDMSYDKGCFCDAGRSQCTIERKGPHGIEHTDCTDKSISRCANGGAANGIQFSDVSNGNLNSQIIALKSKSVEDNNRGIFALSPQSVYVRTSAQGKSCKMHDDCYQMREPDDWCPLPPSDKYNEKGCFCDASSQRCLIERQTANGSEYSDCAEKSQSRCQSSSGIQYSDIQKAEPSQSKSDQWKQLGWLTVSPQGRYVPTSGRPKPCIQQQDCYQMREPNDWCPLPSNDKYYEKGCFCDYARNVCAIEREVPGGSEYTDCADKTTSTCQRS